jgi:outer membrane protein assembly factor BamD
MLNTMQSVLKRMFPLIPILCVMTAVGCTIKPDDLSTDASISDILMLAEQAKSRKTFQEAGDFYMEVDRLYPYSDEARAALIKAMKSYHEGSELTSARLSARRYLKLYPDGPDAPFARYMVGLSFFDAIVDVQRDQGAALHAVREFQKLTLDYPENAYSKLAIKKMDVAYSQLAGQEMSVGRYYMAREDYLAAISRFLIVVSKYSDTIFDVEAFYRLTESYLALGLIDTASDNDLLLQKKYPESEWSLKSKKLINEID